jgi:hypothetical protein
MSDQVIPQNLNQDDINKIFKITSNADLKPETFFANWLPEMSDEFKEKGKNSSGQNYEIYIIDFYTKVYNKMNKNDITDTVINQFLKDDLAPLTKEGGPWAKDPFWDTSMFPQHIQAIKTLWKLQRFDFAKINSTKPSSTNQSSLDRSTFDGNRFAKKIGMYFGIFIGVFLLLCLIAEGASLGMNDYIYKGPFLRAIIGLWFGLGFLAVIPYYIFVGMTDQTKIPHRYALFPLHVGPYEWSAMNSFFGEASYINTVYEPDEQILDRMGLLLTPAQHDKYILPIMFDQASGKISYAAGSPPQADS